MTEEQVFGGKVSPVPQRSVWESMKRGFFGKCPHCGHGRLFRSYLKTVDSCPECGEEIHHHRADDLPAYLVIVIVGHVVVGAFWKVEVSLDWPLWLHMSVWAPLTVAMSLALLGPVKGAVVGLQWALRMHGFGDEKEFIESHPER